MIDRMTIGQIVLSPSCILPRMTGEEEAAAA
jgi:hypothetical protein